MPKKKRSFATALGAAASVNDTLVGASATGFAPTNASTAVEGQTGEWERHEATIRYLYLQQDLEVAEIQKVMDQQYGFARRWALQVNVLAFAFPLDLQKCSKKQFKTRLQQWGLKKYVSKKEMEVIVRIRQARFEKEGKATSFKLHGRDVPEEKIERTVKRCKIDVAVMDASDTTGMSSRLLSESSC
jgi:hypothetical protein